MVVDWTQRLKLRHFQMLLSVAETGNLSQSAEALNTTQPALSKWLKDLAARRGLNRAIVALANKTARIAWALLTRKEEYLAA